jgi:hypothetical protein
MTIDGARTRHYRLACRRCHRTWTAAYQVGTFTDDAGDHEVYFRDGVSATALGRPAARTAAACAWSSCPTDPSKFGPGPG